MQNKRKFGVTNIGTVSLLMIFIVLCMVIFAVLSLSSALSDYHFNEEIALHTKEYYDASNQAEEKLQELLGAPSDSGEKGETILWQFPMNDRQELEVEIRVLPEEKAVDGKRYQILRWEKVNTDEWETDNSLKLIQ